MKHSMYSFMRTYGEENEHFYLSLLYILFSTKNKIKEKRKKKTKIVVLLTICTHIRKTKPKHSINKSAYRQPIQT